MRLVPSSSSFINGVCHRSSEDLYCHWFLSVKSLMAEIMFLYLLFCRILPREGVCYKLNICVLHQKKKKNHVEILTPKAMVLGGGAFGT